jgi:striatin 1/3/4
MSEELAKPDE